ncbi:MAG TPA: hypothetical protein VJB14_05320, partial [Planctomycetota bacterium]|nr:hypothetical protein [Planctomycetota bacterium]
MFRQARLDQPDLALGAALLLVLGAADVRQPTVVIPDSPVQVRAHRIPSLLGRGLAAFHATQDEEADQDSTGFRSHRLAVGRLHFLYRSESDLPLPCTLGGCSRGGRLGRLLRHTILVSGCIITFLIIL